MGVGAGLYMYDVIVKKFTFATSSPDEFLVYYSARSYASAEYWKHFTVRFDGVHASEEAYNSAKREPILKSGALCTFSGAGPGRFWARSAQKPELES